jgi:hypothetical protein
MKYFQLDFEEHIQVPNESKIRKAFWNGVALVAKAIFPSANPDFEERINEVSFYWLEAPDHGEPLREIGFDRNQNPIFLAPSGRNYGVIIDSNVNFENLENSPEIEENFEAIWYELFSQLNTPTNPAAIKTQ